MLNISRFCQGGDKLLLHFLYKLRIRESAHLKTQNGIRIVRHGNSTEQSMPDYQTLKTTVKRSIDQKIRLRNFDARNERLETCAVVTSRRGQIGVERGQGECCQWKAKRSVFERRQV